MANYDNDNNISNYESSDGNVKFTYRKINEHEIEIVEWISVSPHIEIPSHIDSNLKVVSLGENSFRNLLNIERVVVLPSVERICTKAFYALYEVQRSYYSTMYSLSYGEEHKKYCEIFLPAHICIDNISAVLRGAEMRNKFGSYERTIYDSLVITFLNSPTCNYMTENEWRIACQNDELAVLVHKSFGYPFHLFDFKNYVIEYPECWKREI